MFELFDFSKVLDSFNFAKVINSIFMDNYLYLRNLCNNIIGKVSQSNSIRTMLKPTLCVQPEEKYSEMTEYASRIALRSLVNLPPVDANVADINAIKELKGSISWISKNKIDVTEVIREIRDC